MIDQTLQYIDDRRRQFEGDLLALLRIPSVSADPAFKQAEKHLKIICCAGPAPEAVSELDQ